MTRDEMLTELATGMCQVVFVKKNGETRHMMCTREITRIPPDKLPKGDANTIPNDTVMPVYDFAENDWRSFRIDSVLSFNKVPFYVE